MRTCHWSRILFRRLIFWASISIATPAISGKRITPAFDFNARCQAAYTSILSLQMAQGTALLQEEKQVHPDNLITELLGNYIDCISLFFNEDPTQYVAFEKSWESRIDRLKTGDPQSPYYLFSQGVLYFQKAALDMKLGHFWDAGWGMHAAYQRFEENQEKFPRFLPNQMYYHSMKVVAGTIPDGWKWFSRLLGIKGGIGAGMAQLNNMLNQHEPEAALFRQEAVFYYTYLKFYIENDKEGALQFLAQEQPDLQHNHLLAYLTVNLCLNSHQSERATEVMRQLNQGNGYLQTPVWDFEMGNARLYHLEADAPAYLERFLRAFKGTFYRKEALQKLSWYYYLQNDMPKAVQYRLRVLKEGKAQTDPDKQALREAESGLWPQRLLLKARLLSDGGYYQDALGLLIGKRAADFPQPRDQAEFSYRVARIYDETNRKQEAVGFYREAVRLGAKRPEYFAARSALQLGQLFEQQKDYKQAAGWFRTCIDMEDHEYEHSLEQRAKAGLQRCAGQ